MISEQTFQFQSRSTEDTVNFGVRIGKKLRGGEVIVLESDLGGGKTTLVGGLVKGVGSKDRVSSPTFTISKEYKSTNLNIIHYDFYRLPDAGIMAHEITENLEDKKTVVVIEWSEIVKDVLPMGTIKIKIKVIDEESRQFNLSYPNELKYIVED